MRLRGIIVAASLLLLAAGTTVQAAEDTIGYLQRETGIKWNDQTGGPYLWQLINPAAEDTDNVIAFSLLGAAGETLTFSDSSQTTPMTFPRTIDLTISCFAATNDNNIAAGTATLTGTNALGATITDTYTIVDNTAGTLTGSKAFASLVSLVVPVMDDTSCAFSVGLGDDFGLPWTSAFNPVVYATSDGVYETTRPTVAISTTDIESMTCKWNTAISGTNDLGALLWLWPWESAASAGPKLFGR
jgi:hypothetical protein